MPLLVRLLLVAPFVPSLVLCGYVAPAGAESPWVAPLDGSLVVVRPFDPPSVRWGVGHRGVDLAAFEGSTVHAAGVGTVTYAGVLAGRGVVTVTHGALRTTYEPVTPLVSLGDPVAAGEPVATLDPGHEGAPDAVLHWGLLRGETYLDPLLLLRRGPSRLVPVAPADRAPPPVRVDAAYPPAPPAATPPRASGDSGATVARAAAVVGVPLLGLALTRGRRNGAIRRRGVRSRAP